jgi:transcriptional regulator with XRE-family HTH domain
VLAGPDYLLLKKIALRCKKLREERSLTQEDVINDTGIHIGRIETGKRDVSISTLKKLCKYFDVSMSEFFRGIK